MAADRTPAGSPDAPDFDHEAQESLARLSPERPQPSSSVADLVQAVQRAGMEEVFGTKKLPMIPDQGMTEMLKARAERGKSDRLPTQGDDTVPEHPQHWRTNSDVEPL